MALRKFPSGACVLQLNTNRDEEIARVTSDMVIFVICCNSFCTGLKSSIVFLGQQKMSLQHELCACRENRPTVWTCKAGTRYCMQTLCYFAAMFKADKLDIFPKCFNLIPLLTIWTFFQKCILKSPKICVKKFILRNFFIVLFLQKMFYWMMVQNFINSFLFQLEDNGFLTPVKLSQLANVSVLLARERLYTTERLGLACRDESIEGLAFYPNRFLNEDL